MKSNLLLSIIVPIYNSSSFLKRCVDSVYAQGLQNEEFELILVDDGSTDDSLILCKEYQRNKGNIIVFSKENGGQATARNMGLEHAQGKYLMFLDSDDSLETGSLSSMLLLAEQKYADVLLSTMKLYDQFGNVTIQSDYPNYNQVVSGEYAMLDGINLATCCARQYLSDFLKHHNIRFCQGVRHEDVLFSIDVVLCAKRLVSSSLCSYIYFWNEGSTDRGRGEKEVRKSLLGDLAVIKKLKEKANCDALSVPLRQNLLKRSNSLLVSNLIFLMRRYPNAVKNYYIRQAIDEELLPMNGSANSWKSTLAMRVLNALFRISGVLRCRHRENMA